MYTRKDSLILPEMRPVETDDEHNRSGVGYALYIMREI